MSGALRQMSAARKSVAEFDRTAVTGLVEWWEASDLTLSNNAAVASWPGATGNRTLSQGTTIRRPSFQTNQINGLPAVYFDTDRLDTSGSLTQPNTYFIVAQNISVAVFFDGSSGGRNLFYVPSGGQWQIFAGSGVAGPQADTNWFYATCVFDGPSSVMRIGGTEVASGNPGTQNLAATLHVGNAQSIATNQCRIACLAVIDGTLSNAERDQVETYLAARYNL